ncbi:MAG TPA: hypothetical protein VNI61_04390 [Gemmatimonadales bacterium]|nr:hypothetical protein [Gemmatimonadales bacterium]
MTDRSGGAPGGPSPRQVLLVLSGLALAMAVAGALLFVDYTRRHTPDPRRIAVAPFDVTSERPDLAEARVGLARALTAALGASGSYTTVPQAEVARAWRAAATPLVAAIELARRAAAGLAVYGRVDAGPGDSVVLRAAVLDAYSARGLFEVALVAPADAWERAADSLAALVIGRLAER